MKNQYFGDIRDWAKYVFLRQILRHDLSLAVGWMLTEGDSTGDGEVRGYLDVDGNRHVDVELFDWFRAWRQVGAERGVRLIEESGLLGRAAFHSQLLTDAFEQREGWFGLLSEISVGHDVVFLDPDNGFEVRSVGHARRGASKYVFWSEVADLFAHGHSLVVYQHSPRVARDRFLTNRLTEVFDHLPVKSVMVANAMGVQFFVIPQPQHHARLRAAGVAFAAIGDRRLGFEEFDRERVTALGPSVDREPTPSRKAAAIVGSPKRTSPTTAPGTVNRNRQRVVRRTELPGTDHMQRVYQLHCEGCSHDYGANGSDVWLRKCPKCQGGRPGLEFD